MKARRIVALVVGGLFVLPALGILLGGAAVTLVYAFGRDDDGYFDATLDEFESDTVAISVGEDLLNEPGPPDWLFDLIDAEIRIRVTNGDPDSPVFVGIARDVNIANYLEGVGHDRMTGLDGRMPELTPIAGADEVTPPGEEQFWVVSADGVGTQEIEWEVESGNWGAVLMNADGSPGIAAEVNFGAKSGFVLPLGVSLLVVGLLSVTGTVLLIVYGIRGLGAEKPPPPEEPEVGVAAAEQVPPKDAPSEESPPATAPVLGAALDSDLSRWQWLVKWFLAIPHFIVLLFLWIAFMVLTLIAGFAILFTGRYPRGMFDFNVGVMRWTWRVSYYAASGGLGTDRYPPFSLHPQPGYPATLEVPYPERLSRGLVLVKWWLLAIPHYLIVGVFIGSSFYWVADDGTSDWIWVSCGGLIGLLVLIAAIGLLFTNRYPRDLFDMIVGLNRWVFRVAIYSLLMTDDYPPFRLDQGGRDPAGSPLQI